VISADFRPEATLSNGDPRQAMFTVCGKGKAGSNILVFQFRKVFQYFLATKPRGELL
jgi:hypothetical protein